MIMPLDMTRSQQTEDADRFLMWVDGVGGYLIYLSDQIVIGGPDERGSLTDVSLLANLSRQHATITRSGDGYVIQPAGLVSIGRREIFNAMPLEDGYEIRLGKNVRLEFQRRTVLSGTAVLRFLSDHRPKYSVDGVIMMEDNCLLGPGSENHIVCPEAEDSLVLFRRGENLFCKCRSGLAVGEKSIGKTEQVLHLGDVICAANVRFHLERIPELPS
ncbi:MAG: hypothetical protein Tsb009_32930 [Planctomycetaceae bacterium]